MKFKILTNVLLCTLLLMTAATTVTATAAAAEEKPVKCPGKVKVLVEEIVPQPFKEYKLLEIPALPANAVDIQSPLAGTVVKVLAEANTHVNQGQVILALDDESIQKELETANAELKKWKRILFKRQHWKVRSPKAEKTAERKVKENKELIALKEETLKKLKITAPISGLLAEIKVKESDEVSEGFVIATVMDIDKVKVPLGDFSEKVSDGQEVKVKIKEISSVVAGAVEAEEAGKSIVIPNPERKIQAKMHAMFKVLFKEHKDVVVLPKDRIFKDDSGSFVYTVNGKYARKSILTLGPEHKNDVLITDGLAKGDEIIVSEILSSKKGTLKDEIQCIHDNKKIKIYVKHQTKNKYVKRKKSYKKVKPVKPIKPIEPAVKKVEPKKEEPKKEEPQQFKPKKIKKKKRKPAPTEKRQRVTFGNKLRFGVSASFFSMSDSNFKDIYGSMTGFNIDLSYRFTEKFDIWFAGGMTKKTGNIELPEGVDLDSEAEFKLTPISIDLRYFLYTTRKFDVFIGAGLSLYSFEDKNALYEVKDSTVGFNFLGGAYYNITQKFGFQFIVKYNSAKKDLGTIEIDGEQVQTTQELKLDNLELMIGITYDF